MEKFNQKFSQYLRKANVKERLEHEPSGKISPTKLTCTTLEAVLQLLQVPPDPPSDQSLRYFIRGHTLEEIALKAIKSRWTAKDLQVLCEYNGAKGYADAFYKVPHEIKSAGNWTFKNAPLDHHKLQVAFYGLAKESPYCWLHYINAETFQISSYKVFPQAHEEEIGRRMNLIRAAFRGKSLPDWKPLEPYHKSKTFTDYSKFYKLTGKEAMELLDFEYPEHYKKLKEGLEV